ncbi:hypothetical protein VTJ04DRAFT_6807 [Mycothermus thermophilus]|uniref:uncharacterized protein n=1 Tax=Humicola insolens TaxID=85995 RepID=UPI00374412CB
MGLKIGLAFFPGNYLFKASLDGMDERSNRKTDSGVGWVYQVRRICAPRWYNFSLLSSRQIMGSHDAKTRRDEIGLTCNGLGGGSGLGWTQGHQLALCRVGLAWLVGRSFGKSGRFTRQQHQQQQDRIGLGFSFGYGNATLRLWFVYLR